MGGGEIGQLLTSSRPGLTPGWGLGDESHPLDSWIFGSNFVQQSLRISSSS